LIALVSYILHRRTIQIIDQGFVFVPFGKRFLIHPDSLRYFMWLPRSPSAHGVLHHLPTRVPADIQQPTYALNAAFLLQVDHKALKLVGHSGLVVSKTGQDLLYPVFGTLNARKTNMDEGRHLTHIQMPELSLLCVVIHRTQLLTLWARKGKIGRMIDIDVNPPILLIQNHLRYKPGTSDPEELSEKCSLLHKDTGLNENGHLKPGPDAACETSMGLSADIWRLRAQALKKLEPIIKAKANIPYIVATHTNQRCGLIYHTSEGLICGLPC
jgi:hypothetical protein